MLFDPDHISTKDTPIHKEVHDYIFGLPRLKPQHVDVLPDDCIMKQYLYFMLLCGEDPEMIFTCFIACIMMCEEEPLAQSYNNYRRHYSL